jgi:hypothetical protein
MSSKLDEMNIKKGRVTELDEMDVKKEMWSLRSQKPV